MLVLEQNVIENYSEILYSLYVANVLFREFIDNFRNIGGAQTIVARIIFQVELFNLEQSGMALLNRTSRFKPPAMVFCHYASQEIKIYDNANREPKTAFVNYYWKKMVTNLLRTTYNIDYKDVQMSRASP